MRGILLDAFASPLRYGFGWYPEGQVPCRSILVPASLESAGKTVTHMKFTLERFTFHEKYEDKRQALPG